MTLLKMNRSPSPPALRILVLLFLSSLGTAMGLGVVDPRVEYLESPLGIDVRQPRLGWKLESTERAQSQGAYRVLVASSLELLGEDKGDLWDSGKVVSGGNIQIAYAGKPLASRQLCHWKVMVWNQDDRPSEWSKPVAWSMGLLDPADWKAGWIGYDKVPAEPARQASEVIIVKALYGATGNTAKQVDVTEELRRRVADGAIEIVVDKGLAGSDPAEGIKKALQVEFTLDGVTLKRRIGEGQKFMLHSTTAKELRDRSYLPSPHLRREFAVTGAVKRAMIHVSAQGVFELRLNGRRVGDEFYMPGWTDYRKRIYYRSYNVTELLEQGPNAIGAILGDGWFRGNISILGQNQYGRQLRLMAQLEIDYDDGRNETIATDASWKAAFGPILLSDMHAGEIYDARLEMPGWDRPGHADQEWAPVDTGSALKETPLIQAYPGDPVRRTAELATVKLTEPLPGIHVFDMGQNFSGWVRLKVRGRAGDKVVMRFGEMLNEDGTVFTDNLRSARATDTYILKGGEEEIWEPHFTFHGFRYVEVTGLDDKPAPDLLTGIVVHTDARMTSSFECSDPMLNQLHRNIVWGQRSNYLEVPTDCPQRDERLGWTGDTQVYIRTGTYHQDVAAFFTKWMVDLMDSVDGRGVFGNQAPVFHGHGSPGWSDAGIICPWTIYKIYGDTRIIEVHYDVMARYLEACGKNGLNGLRQGMGDWLSIGSNTPKDLVSVAYYAYCSHLMAEMAAAIGKDEDARKYRELFGRIREHFQKSFVEPDGKIRGHTQTGYCMALHYDLLTNEQRARAAEHLVERIKAADHHHSVGFLGVPILLPTLTQIGRSDLAYRLLRNKTYPSWGYSVEQGATTIWERWDSWTLEGGFNAGEMNSFNHYAFGSCGEWMFSSMLGIDTAGAAFREIVMKPEIGHGITWARGHYDSIHGRIASEWRIGEGRLQWNVTIPANTVANLHVPAGRLADLTDLNEDGRPLADAHGVVFLREEGGRVVLRVGSGNYSIGAIWPAGEAAAD
jgi:alpha-L-rhamnosidase